MAQVKVYGIAERLLPVRDALSDVIHDCVVEALQFPRDKRAHRFFPLDASDFFYPDGRTDRYTILEFSMFEGRSVEAKKTLIRLLFARVQEGCGISPTDLEITITETPKSNWGFRGLPGDEHTLNYKIDV